MKINAKYIDRFWSQVVKTDTCWLWSGTPNKVNGYGRVNVGRAIIGAHRLSYMLMHGDIPKGLIVRHTCDTPLCVNPEHLVTGTQKDNMQDCIERGRKPRGEHASTAKLSNREVADIRWLYENRAWPIVRLAKHFSVDRTTISRIVHGRHRAE